MLQRRELLHCGLCGGAAARIGKSNGLFHRLLRPPCRPLPTTGSSYARSRPAAAPGPGSAGRWAWGSGRWGCGCFNAKERYPVLPVQIVQSR